MNQLSFIAFMTFALSMIEPWVQCQTMSPDPNELCRTATVYSNPLNCHSYFECQYVDETNDANAVLKFCQQGDYFDSETLACRPEGPLSCQPPPCEGTSTNCYQLPGQSCREFFTCIDDEARCCPINSRFDVNTCECYADPTCSDVCPLNNTYQEPASLEKQCELYLPFDTNFDDASVNRFETFINGDAFLDTNVSAFGGGSLKVSDGNVEISNLKSLDHGEEASWCLFFRCENQPCSQKGGILSNNVDKTMKWFTFIGAVLPNNLFATHVGTVRCSPTLRSPLNNDGWNQVCVIFKEKVVNVYVNGEFAGSRRASTGALKTVDFPYIIGTDQLYGNFAGNIDEVLICKHALSDAEIQSHFTGNLDALRMAGLIP